MNNDDYQLWLECMATRRKPLTNLTEAQLKALLRYDPKTAEWIWLVDCGRNKTLGKRAGFKNSNGYWVIRVNGTDYLASRLAFLYMTGAWPKNLIDHINRQRDDDRWINLREADYTQNRSNRKYPQRALPTGVCKRGSRYVASCCHVYLGKFDTVEAAEAAYQKAARELYDVEFLPDGVLKPAKLRRI